MNAIMMLHRAMAGYLAAQGGGGGSKYIEFADPAVEAVLMAKGVSSDGVGITTADVEKVTDIGTWFKGNTEITSFDEYEKFKNATFNSNTGLNSASFNGCSNLESIILPKTPTTMDGTFNECSSLATIGNLEYVTKVDNYTFNNCTALKIEVNMPNLSGTIGDAAFRGSGITDVISLGATTEIAGTGNNTAVFGFCANLQSVNLPSTLMKIGGSAFYGCTSLEIPDLALPNLTSLGQNAFYGVKIKKISNLGKITEIVNVKATSNMMFGDRGVVEEVVLPNSLLTVGNYAFANYTKAKITLPTSLVTVRSMAFYKCESMDSDVALPNLTTLEDASFRLSGITRVSNLGSITKIAGGTNIESTGTFNKCLSLSYVNIPSSVTSIEGYAFRGCSSLTTLVVGNSTPPSLASTAFTATPIASGTGFIYVPDASVDAYKAATNWATYRGVIKAKVRIEAKIASETSDQLTMYHITDVLDATWEITSGNDIASISSSGLITFSSYGTVTVVGRSGEHEASIEIVHKQTTTLFSIDETMTTTPHDTGLCLFSDAIPKWTIAVNAVANFANRPMYASLLSCEHTDSPYRGLCYIRDASSQNMMLAFNGGSGTVYKGQLIPVIIRRNENLIEYSTDGTSYTTVIPDVSSVVNASPSLAEIPLWVGNNCNGLSRQFAGRVKCVIYDDVVDSPLLELD